MGSSSGIKNIFIHIYILSSQAPPMTPVTMGERERESARFFGGGIENGKQHG